MIELIPLHPRFAVEVRGVDLTAPLDDATFAAVRDAFERHSLLVFRGQPVDDAQQIAFSRRFGPLEDTKVGSPGAGTPLVILTNVAPDGSFLPPDHRQQRNHRANQLWHSDSSFKPVPALASLLSGRQVAGTGGETQWLSTRAAWRELPADLQARCEGRVVVHHFAHSRRQIDGELTSAEEQAALPPVRHALVRTNPVTGEMAVYVGSHAVSIEGMPEAEGRALLDALMAFVTQPRFVYSHTWQPHDLVVWDNRCTLHRGRPWPATELVRTMVRTTVAGDGPTVPPTVAPTAASTAAAG